jgi:hypothetical protein
VVTAGQACIAYQDRTLVNLMCKRIAFSMTIGFAVARKPRK